MALDLLKRVKILLGVKNNSSLDREFFQNLPTEFAIFDLEGKYKFANIKYIVDEKTRAQVIGKDDAYYFDLIGISEECIEKRKEMFHQVIQEQRQVRFTEKLIFPGINKTVYYKRSFQPVFKKGRKNRLSEIHFFGDNMTAVIHSQQELKFLAFHDKVTGLRNREAFYHRTLISYGPVYPAEHLHMPAPRLSLRHRLWLVIHKTRCSSRICSRLC